MLVVTVAWSVCNKQISVHTLAPLTAMPFHTTGREIGAGASVTPELLPRDGAITTVSRL
jgi:hypothetical protein